MVGKKVVLGSKVVGIGMVGNVVVGGNDVDKKIVPSTNSTIDMYVEYVLELKGYDRNDDKRYGPVSLVLKPSVNTAGLFHVKLF
jgi:hypothetical protein